MKQTLCFSILALAFTSMLSGLAIAAPKHPCMEKQEAKHSAHKALHECIMSWTKDVKPADADPGDDCTAKLSGFVQAAKDLKACRAQNTKK